MKGGFAAIKAMGNFNRQTSRESVHEFRLVNRKKGVRLSFAPASALHFLCTPKKMNEKGKIFQKINRRIGS
jgi:hypothetical protein